jgi:hypothetical protein
VQIFCKFQVTIILALLAFFGSTRSSRRKKMLAVILSVSYVGFAYANLVAIKDVTNARNITKQIDQELGSSGKRWC